MFFLSFGVFQHHKVVQKERFFLDNHSLNKCSYLPKIKRHMLTEQLPVAAIFAAISLSAGAPTDRSLCFFFCFVFFFSCCSVYS